MCKFCFYTCSNHKLIYAYYIFTTLYKCKHIKLTGKHNMFKRALKHMQCATPHIFTYTVVNLHDHNHDAHEYIF